MEHPVRPQNPPPLLSLSPADILVDERDQYYIRQFRDTERFRLFVESVEREGAIHQAVGVRRNGEGRPVLLYGLRRLLAARGVGLAAVPARDYGAVSAAQSLHLQLLENEAREAMHVVDTALAYALRLEGEEQQADLARAYGRSRGYVSVMCKAGRALRTLDEAERMQLYMSPAVTARLLQKVSTIPDDRARASAILSAARSPGRREKDDLFHVRPYRSGGGRRLEVRWKDRDLRERGAQLVEEFRAFMVDEVARMERRLQELERIPRARRRRRPPRRPLQAPPPADDDAEGEMTSHAQADEHLQNFDDALARVRRSLEEHQGGRGR